MANDGGLIAVLEQWMADALAALDIFKTVDVWRHQISPGSGGMEAFTRYAPFAFVSWQSTATAREGGNDLRQVLGFAVLIGAESKSAGLARFGSTRKKGTSKIRDLVIAAFDKKRPDDEAVTCDEFYYTGDVEVLDQPNRHAIQINFEVSQLIS